MKIVEINAVVRGSTGKIMLNIASIARQQGHSVYTVSAPKKNESLKDCFFIGSKLDYMVHRCYSVTTGISGTMSKHATHSLVKKLKKICPDVLHLHNLHGWYINLPILFDYIKQNNVRVVWTLHDCWAFTAQCSHFMVEKCEKWRTGCFDCPRYRMYPFTYVDRTKAMYKLKKKWFTGVKDLTIVTPSQWLADLVKQSYLKDYPVKVIHNGIDLSIFKPTESDFRKKYNCEDKYILLGVAFGWGERKGLDVFVELSKRLDEHFQIVLVGTDDNVDKQLPQNIISIHRTHNQKELAEIYSAADLFVNPTREEVLGMVNIEANACGTPVLTFNTGGAPECIDQNSGGVVDCDDIDTMEREIRRIAEEKPFSIEACLERAKSFDMNERFEEYIALYETKLR